MTGIYIDNQPNLVSLSKVFTEAECAKIIDYCLNEIKLEGGVNETSIYLIPKDEIRWLYDKVADLMKMVNSHYFNFDISNYADPIQFIEHSQINAGEDWHLNKNPDGYCRKLSVVIQLSKSTDYEGADLHIHAGKIEGSKKSIGSATIFPSFMLNRITPLKSGKRYSLVCHFGGGLFK